MTSTTQLHPLFAAFSNSVVNPPSSSSSSSGGGSGGLSTSALAAAAAAAAAAGSHLSVTITPTNSTNNNSGSNASNNNSSSNNNLSSSLINMNPPSSTASENNNDSPPGSPAPVQLPPVTSAQLRALASGLQSAVAAANNNQAVSVAAAAAAASKLMELNSNPIDDLVMSEVTQRLFKMNQELWQQNVANAAAAGQQQANEIKLAEKLVNELAVQVGQFLIPSVLLLGLVTVSCSMVALIYNASLGYYNPYC
ncbi:unnamed protein product [Allacma fusca]|uniref:Uncharacterized protein n=1 Tax=Allacma fusca TaxID=39272 RepID=A0A8J2KKG4_9HEXA|nr:unnamed protein product [Allacma fusca]